MMRKFVSLFVFASLNIALAFVSIRPPVAMSQSRQAGQLSVLRVRLRTPADITLLINHYDVLEARDGDALFVLGDDAVLADLRAQDFTVAIHTNLPTYQPSNLSTQQPNNLTTFFSGYRTVAEHEAHMDAVVAAHPDLAKVIDYGNSWRKVNNVAGGHDLKAICITKRRPQDCALNPATDKPRFFLMAAIHARELTTSEMAWRWMDYLVDNYDLDADVTWLLDHHEMWVVPVANPDGRTKVEEGGNSPYLQRKNLNDSQGDCATPPTASNQIGVDLNRNASFQFGVAGTSSIVCSQTYAGENAASEPEQVALENLMRALFPDQRADELAAAAPISTTGAMLTLHSFSDLVLLPWGWTECFGSVCPADKQAPNDAGLRAMAFRMSHYNGYATGQASELLYAASGTTDDWAYGVLGIPGFTFEIGPDSGPCEFFTPPYSCQDSTFWPLNRGAFVYAAKLAREPYALSLGPNTLSVTLSSSQVMTGTPVTITAVVNDNALGNSGIARPAAQPISTTELYVDTPPWAGGVPTAMLPADGAFDTASESTIATLDTATLSLGRHTVFVRGRDADGNWGPVTAQFLVVMGGQRTFLPWVSR